MTSAVKQTMKWLWYVETEGGFFLLPLVQNVIQGAQDGIQLFHQGLWEDKTLDLIWQLPLCVCVCGPITYHLQSRASIGV